MKGRALPELHHHPDRVDYPLAKRDGKFSRVSWDVAIQEIADRLKEICDESGPDAIGVYWASGDVSTAGLMGSRGFAAAIGTGSYFTPASIDLPSKHVVQFEMTNLSRYVIPLADMSNTDCLLLLGSNPAVSMGHDYSAPMGRAALKSIQKRGGKVIVVDPCVSESAELADIHVAVRPGGDPFFLQAVLAVIVEERLIDQEFMDEHCSRFDQLSALVSRDSVSELAARCGVPVETIERVARVFAGASSAVAIAGTGLTFGRYANTAIWLQCCLNAVTGNIDRQGGMYFNRGALNPMVPRPSKRSLYSGRQSRVRSVRSLNGEMPSSALADEILTEGPGRIRALIVHGGNPFIVLPNQARTKEAFESLDLLVSMDIFLTQTGEFADYVLPGIDQLEREDVSAVVDQLYPIPFAQVYAKVVEPVAERRSEYGVYLAILEQMGLGETAMVPEEELLSNSCRNSGRSLDELRSSPHGEVMGQPEYGWFLDGLQTPDGRLNLVPDLCAEEFDRARSEAKAEVDSNSFPMRLVARRMVSTFNTALTNVPSTARQAPTNALLVHPEDARRIGVSDGDPASVSSRIGSVDVEVRVTARVAEGVVSLPHGWGGTSKDGSAPKWRGGNVNWLTDDREAVDPITGMPEFTGVPVRVERA